MENQLKNLILTHLPFPIAVYFNKMLNFELLARKGKTSQQFLFFSLLDVFEMINRFLAAVMLSNYVQFGAFSTELNQFLASKLQKKLSLGDWHSIFRETLRVLANHKDKMFIPELTDFYFGTNAKLPKISLIFDRLINLRNKKKGHSFNLTPDEYKNLYFENLPALIEIFEGLTFWSNYRIISPVEFTEGKISTYIILNGAYPVLSYDDIEINTGVNEGEILIFEKEKNNINKLLLSPLSYFDVDYETDLEKYVCFFDETKSKKSVVSFLTYLGINAEAKSKPLKILQKDELRKEWFETFTKMLTCITQETVALASRTPLTQEYYFQSQLALIEFHKKYFVGREEVFSELNNFIQKNSSGYFLIQGTPGQGKTAALAKLVDQKTFAHHFICDSEGRNDEVGMIKSLYYQISKKLDREHFEIPINPEDLKRMFGNLLQSFSEYCIEKNIKEAIVIDGLDELNQKGESLKLSYLPEHLPSNLFVILSSRPVLELEGFQRKINYIYSLSDLAYEDVKQIILKRIPHLDNENIIKIYNNSKGNPLFLKCILDTLEDDNRTYSSIPQTIEQLFNEFMKKIRTLDGTPLAIFGLLVAAKEGLSIYEISKILKKPKFNIAQAIGIIYPFLIKSEQGYSLFHKTFVDFLQNEKYEHSFEKEEINRFNKLIIEYCEPFEEKGLEYAFKYLPNHYFYLNNFENVLRLAKNKEFHESTINLLYDLTLKFERASKYEQYSINKFFEYFLSSKEPLITRHILEAFERAISQGVFDFSLKILLQLKKNHEKEDCRALLGQIMFEIASIYREKGELEQANNLFEEIQNEPNQIDKKLKIKIGLQYANTSRELGNHDSAINLYNLSLEELDVKKNPEKYLDIWVNLCDLVYVRGQFVKAFNQLEKAVILAQHNNLKLQEGDIKRIQGQIFYVLDDFDEALKYFYESLDIYSKLNDKIRLGRIYNNLSLAEAPLNIKKAENFSKLGFELNSHLSTNLEKGKSLLSFSVIERMENNLHESQKYIEEAITTFKMVGYRSGLATALHHQALIYYASHDFDKALVYAEQSNEHFQRKTAPSYPIYIFKNNTLRNLIYESLGEKEKVISLLDDQKKLLETIETFTDITEVTEKLKRNILKEGSYGFTKFNSI